MQTLALFFFLLFFSLKDFPILKYLGRIIRLRVTKYMGMAMNQLVAEGIENIIEGEGALFLGHFSVEKHL